MNQDFINGEQNELKFTFCNTPFLYRKSNKKSIEIFWNDKAAQHYPLQSNTIPNSIAENIFKRNGKIARVVVHL